jgi:hypothetical protein
MYVLSYEDLKEHRAVFFPFPKFTLSQYITRQMLINTIEPDETLRRTPEIMLLVLKRLEVLYESKHISAQKVLAGFYDLNNLEFFDEPWSKFQELNLAGSKVIINDGDFVISKQRDTRILCQTLLDYLEGMLEPAISHTTVEHLSTLTNSGLSSKEIISSQLIADAKPKDPRLVGVVTKNRK